MVENIRQHLVEQFPGQTETQAYNQIQKDTGISLSSMQRIMSGNTGPSIDTLADLAKRLGTTPWALLTPKPGTPHPPASDQSPVSPIRPLPGRLHRRRASP